MPVRHRSDLREIDIGGALNRRKSGELKNKIGEPEKDEGEPDPFVAKQTTETVAQREAHRVKEQDDYVTAQQPDQRVNPGQTREHRFPNESSPSAE